ncbi:hypothetical protein [Alicyclobacillus ferrooxydans]|uniref:Uncharacterized protein n=1 Tax=Alicyclobacillus ferrooxydans TaxID=471514 RepID=A0A0P9D7H5_9BACL|nr:hypothetical protein [Alicyclobacillus ferrooxydans]KPV45268.1 hypothetical protein AN477_02405 [Alicyclobacillus ferrooxydans]
MIWFAMLFVGGTVAEWIIVKPKQKFQDWAVQLVLLGMTVFFAVLVETDVWPQLDPLEPLKAVFMPMTEWIYNHV